eukprot:scaffold35115_cov144-Skeletonema_dohrnii-CCMP3373.AAC.1
MSWPSSSNSSSVIFISPLQLNIVISGSFSLMLRNSFTSAAEMMPAAAGVHRIALSWACYCLLAVLLEIVDVAF